MSNLLRMITICISALMMGAISFSLARQKLSVRYALPWLFALLALLLLALFPQLTDWAVYAANDGTDDTLLLSAFIMILLALMLQMTLQLSRQNARIIRDTQCIALMERRIAELEAACERNSTVRKQAM